MDLKRDQAPDCPHCGGPSIHRGSSRGHLRYACKQCLKTFALTGRHVETLAKKARHKAAIEHQIRGIRAHIQSKRGIWNQRREDITVFDATGLPKAEKLDLLRTAYPNCPKCEFSLVIRAGIINGFQRYRCKNCSRTFGGRGILNTTRTTPLICHRCGGTNCKGLGYDRKKMSRRGRCLDCKRHFYQGGRDDLDKNHLYLRHRVKTAVPGHTELQNELFQLAAQAVIDGDGYCWNVELDMPTAKRNTFGEYAQTGSNHPAFRLQQNQPPRD